MNQTQGNSKEVGTPRYLSLVVPLRKVGDEAVHKELGDRMERAATTASSSEAEQDSGSGPRCQDTILGDVDAQTRFETTSEQSNDPPLSKVNTFGSGEDSMKILELMEIVHNCLHCYLWDEIEVNAGSSNLLLLVSVNAARHQLLLLVQVPAAEGDSINTSIKGFTYFFIRFHSFKHSLNISPNSISSLIIKIIIMSSPKFAETHNVVAFLEKPAESDGFAEIIDFLKASSVSYALTVNPIIYTSCIQQFWATAQVKMVNGVRQLQTLIDKKKVIITEASIRNDLHLDDAEVFFSPQWKFMIHTITQSLSAKTTAWNEFSSIMASLIICLATNRKFNMSKYIFDAMVKHLNGGVKFLLKEAETTHAETEEEEHLNTPSNDPLHSGEDIEIASFKKRVSMLEKRRQLRTTGLTRFKKLDAELILVNEQQNEDLMFDTGVLDDDEIFVDVASSEKNEQSTNTSTNLGFRYTCYFLNGHINFIITHLNIYVTRLNWKWISSKDRKPSQNDKTEHGMEKTVQNQGQSPKMPKSINTENQRVKPREPELKNTIGCNLYPSDGPGKPNSIIMSCEDQMGTQSITTAHLCAIDKDCEDFEGPILAQLQPISAIVHTKPTPTPYWA
ncbi:hypothetical protein Tco_0607915 [Tanacetum coccineum]